MVCCCANSFQALASVGIRSPAHAQDDEQEGRGDQRARRDEGDRRDRAEADLGQRIGRAPAARQREQQRIVAPAAPDLWSAQVATAAAPVGGFHFTRLMVPEKVNSVRSPDFSVPRRKISEPPARVISPVPSTSSPSLRGVEEFAGKRYRHARSLQHRGGDREQAIIGKRHEAAAMDVAHAVEVLLLDPERALHLAVVVDPVPERPVMGLEIVAGPGAPAREFALGFDVQIGAVEECGFGEFVHGKWPFKWVFQPLNPIRARCANADPARLPPQSSGQGENAP